MYFDSWTQEAAGCQQRVLILWVDGHRTHYSIAVFRYAVPWGVTLLSDPGHTTHFLLPLGVGPFKPLQKAYCMTTHAEAGPASLEAVLWLFQGGRQAYAEAGVKAT